MATGSAPSPRPLRKTLRVFHQARKPEEIWRDLLGNADHLDAARTLGRAIMDDIGHKPSWSAAWRVGARIAYELIYRPVGLYRAESDHLAVAIGRDVLSPADLAAMQRLYTVTHAGCSTVMAWDKARSRMIHFRCLDWPSTDAIANASRIFIGCDDHGATTYQAVGIVGMVGLLTAVKPGFSVAVNFAPWRGPSLSLRVDPTFLMRQLMESDAASFDDAVASIRSWRPSAPVYISLCGTKQREAAVFEFGAAWSRPDCHVNWIGDRDFLVQTNHFHAASPFARQNAEPAPSRDWDHPDWDAETLRRTSTARRVLIEERLGAAYAESPDFDIEAALREIYGQRPVWNHETAQWAMMVPETGEVRAWTR